MKDFKKWWDNDSIERDWDYEHYAAIGWDRALEWVLKNFDGETDMLTLGLKIREELEE